MDWNFRAEIIEISHRWPIIVAFILVGSLVGGLLAYAQPSPYQAESRWHVTYNADVSPRNPDDWKNWQMEQLDILIHSDSVLQETLTRLQAQDPAWADTTLDKLAASTHTYWRNAGEWRLVAEALTSGQAAALVDTWGQVSLEQLDQALSHASETLYRSIRMDEIATNLVALNLDIASLSQIQAALNTWIQDTNGGDASQPLDPRDRWLLLSRVSGAAGWDSVEISLLEETPAPDAPASEYLPWVDRSLISIAQRLEVMAEQYNQLKAEYDRLYAEHAVQLEESRGLTAYLSAGPLDQEDNQAQRVRSTGSMAFVGGLLGLLVWMLIYLARPLIKVRKQSAV